MLFVADALVYWTYKGDGIYLHLSWHQTSSYKQEIVSNRKNNMSLLYKHIRKPADAIGVSQDISNENMPFMEKREIFRLISRPD